MKHDKYFLITFDYQRGQFSEEEIVNTAIARLHSYYYANRCLKISWNALLIKPNPKDVNYYNSPEYFVGEAFCEAIEKHSGDTNGINFFIVPIELEIIKSYISKFEKELEYINSLDDGK